MLGLLAGAALAVWRFPGRRLVLVLLNTLLALPSVVVGLVVYLMLSRAGPLGAWGILFTPAAMVLAQAILVTPIVAALSHQTIADALREPWRATAVAGCRAAPVRADHCLGRTHGAADARAGGLRPRRLRRSAR
jgi:ABC-type tungstate transport system substrate-binding protein